MKERKAKRPPSAKKKGQKANRPASAKKSPEMLSYDPAQLDRLAAPVEVYEPGDDYLLLNGLVPHTPGNMADGKPCETCGFAVGERIVRRRAILGHDGEQIAPPRVGRVICLNCGRGSGDGVVRYNGLREDAYPNEAWRLEYPDEAEGEKVVPKYQPGALAGGMGSKVRRRKGKVKA